MKFFKKAKNKDVKGEIFFRLCECCNHHEVVVKTKEGKFIKLNAGMKVIIKGEDK